MESRGCNAERTPPKVNLLESKMMVGRKASIFELWSNVPMGRGRVSHGEVSDSKVFWVWLMEEGVSAAAAAP